MQDLKQLEADLWEAADQLRANSRLTAGEYSMPVLGLIFLRQAANRFAEVTPQLAARAPRRGGTPRPLTPADYRSVGALYLPETARYDYLVSLPEDANIGAALTAAMEAIETQSAMLKNVLPKEYARFDPRLLRDLLRKFNSDVLRSVSGDVFGRIYEYFLNKFAMTGAQEGGEFFTPPALVRLIVNVIEPQHGKVLDCAVGSAGMFVQTGYFIEERGQEPGRAVTFYGQEKSDLTIRLARMNLAVHGLEGTIYEGNTYYDTLPDLVGGCDFVMANPPFNVDMVDPQRVKGDPRLPFGIPGVSQKTGAVSNANYLWIQYFYSYLNPAGRAGFVMASSATDAGHGEKRIRRQLIETGDVDAVVAIGTNFFYTRSLPCTLWFFDKAKPAARQDTVLMIDARGIHRVVTRKVRDFSDEQLQNLTAIVRLYRGEQARFLALVGDYLAQAHAEAARLGEPAARLARLLDDLAQRLADYAAVCASEPAAGQTGRGGKNGAENEVTPADVAALRDLLAEQRASAAALSVEAGALLAAGERQLALRQALGERANTDNAAQHTLHDRFAPLAEQMRGVQRRIHETYKRTEAAVAHAEKALGARRHPAWDSAAVRDLLAQAAAQRDAAAAAIHQCLYILAQATWLQSRFPEAEFRAVPGLCAAVTRAEISAHDSSLTPGRYVGVGAPDMEDDEEFAERMQEIHAELAGLNAEAVELVATILRNFEELDI